MSTRPSSRHVTTPDDIATLDVERDIGKPGEFIIRGRGNGSQCSNSGQCLEGGLESSGANTDQGSGRKIPQHQRQALHQIFGNTAIKYITDGTTGGRLSRQIDCPVKYLGSGVLHG